MTVYTAYPSNDSLESKTNEILERINSKDSKPMNQLATELAFEYIDVWLQAMFHEPVELIEMTPFRRKLTDTMGTLIVKTTHTLIKQVVKKLSNDEITVLKGYIEERRIYIDGKPHVSFPLDQHFTTRFYELYEAAESGNVSKQVNEMIEIMNDHVDAALHFIYKMPTGQLKLGMIAKKAVSFGYDAIRKGAHSTVRKISSDLSDEERIKNLEHLNGLLVNGPDYTGAQ